MPTYCSVFGCYSSSATSNESFFQYPSEQHIRRSWIVRVRREGFSPTSTSYVCSRHFSEDQFSATKSDAPGHVQRKRLKRGSIPNLNLRGSVTDEHLQKQITTCSRKALDSLSPPLSSSTAITNEIPNVDIFDTPDNAEKQHMDNVEQLSFELNKLKVELEKAKLKIKKLEKARFLYRNLADCEVQHYTGLSRAIFQSLADLISRFHLTYWSGSSVTSVDSEDQLRIFFMKLRLDLPYFDLAHRFSLSQTTIQNIFMTYLHAVHEIVYLGLMRKIPSLEKNKCTLPESFGSFTNCRILVDCTEFCVTVPRKDLEAASSSYSNYKKYLTGKFLIGVAPNGCITFVSDGFPGSTSDKTVAKESGLLHHLQV